MPTFCVYENGEAVATVMATSDANAMMIYRGMKEDELNRQIQNARELVRHLQKERQWRKAHPYELQAREWEP